MTLEIKEEDDGVFHAYDDETGKELGIGATREEAKQAATSGIDVRNPDPATALDEAQAALAQHNGTKRKPEAVPKNDEQTPSKPAKRRRSIKVYDWMRRATNKEENWRLGDPAGYKTAVDTIAKIKAGVPAIKGRYPFRDYYPIEEYGFNKPFDLADRLVGLLETYKRNKAQPPMKERLDEHKRRLMEIRKTSSLANATTMEKTWLAVEGYQLHRDPVMGREKHDLQKAVRKMMAEHRKKGGAGRYLTPEAMLARGLAGTYYLGTGRWPVTGSPRQFRGPYACFARDCLALLNITVTNAILRDQAAEMRTYFKEREERRAAR